MTPVWKRTFVVTTLVLAAAGCVTTSGPKSVYVAPTQRVATEKVPGHVKAVIAAVIQRLRGASGAQVATATGVAGAGAVPQMPGFTYDGFAVSQVKISGFATPADDVAKRRVSGYLNFRDASGRRAVAVFGAEYALAGTTITITSAATSPLYAPYPSVEMFMVPLQALKSTAPKGKTDYAALYKRVMANAVPMRGPGVSAAQKGDYVIAVFAKDRQAPGSSFQAGVSAVQSGTGSHLDGTKYLTFDNGWPVAMIPGSFADEGPAFWTKAVYTPGPETPEGERSARVVGLFSSQPLAAAPANPPRVKDPPDLTRVTALTSDQSPAPASTHDAALRQARGTPAPGPDTAKAAVNQAPRPNIIIGRAPKKT
jgi:hypothetical protein